jgi:hypothetical protein
MSKTRTKQKQATREKMIREANARHDLQFGPNPTIVNYAKHIAGRKDIAQKK